MHAATEALKMELELWSIMNSDEHYRNNQHDRSVHFQSNDHAVGGLAEAVPLGSFEHSVQSDGLIPEPYSEFIHAQAKAKACELDLHELRVAITANNQLQCDPVPSTPRSEPKKGTRKRDRDRNWTEQETSLLVECKRAAFHDKGSPFHKAKSNATNWDAISQELWNNPATRASEKTGDQCRLRWDTLVKSHRTIKVRCLQKNKGYSELTEEEMSELKLATTIDKGWYEVIDTISRKARSQKGRGKLTPSVGGFANPEIRVENVPLDQLVGKSQNAPTDHELHDLFLEGAPPVSIQNFLPSRPPTEDQTGGPDLRKSLPKQIAIPGFSSMEVKLRATLLDLILGVRFLKGRNHESCFFGEEDENLLLSCRWLSIVQNRSCSKIYNDVIMLVIMKLVHISEGTRHIRKVSINQSRFRVFDKFVKKVILHNPVYDTHWRIVDKTVSTLEAFSVAQQIRVLKLENCKELKTANFRGLRKLRSLCILKCPKLVEVTGWKFLRELGWLEIYNCRSYRDYPGLQDLPSLREFRFNRDNLRNCPPRHELGISRCVRARRLEICHDDTLYESGDLSSLKCLEILSFDACTNLLTISGLSGLHLLTSLHLGGCISLHSLPDIGHMKELVHVDISHTRCLEEIPGIEKLVSLKWLDCIWSKLKRLPDLHHLPELGKVFLKGTPLIEEDPSSFYFDKEEVVFNREERGHVDVSDISDTEYIVTDSEASSSDDSMSL